MNCDYRDRVLSYLDSHGTDEPELEKHIAECPQCSAMVSGYLEAEQRMKLPQTFYQGRPDALKEQVRKFNAGFGRIVIFTVVGLILGWFSYSYRTMGFWPIKAVIAVPYMLGLWVHTLLHHHSTIEIQYASCYFHNTAFFSGSAIATLVGERIVAVFFGGVIYGTLAYCTGDKRIFTLQRLMKFVACWAAVIALMIGLSFGINAYQTNRMETLKNIEEIWIPPETEGSPTVWTPERDPDVYAVFYSGLVRDNGPIRDQAEEIPVTFTWKNQREVMVVLINCEKRYLVTSQGTLWRISPQFAQSIADRAYNTVTEKGNY